MPSVPGLHVRSHKGTFFGESGSLVRHNGRGNGSSVVMFLGNTAACPDKRFENPVSADSVLSRPS